MRQETVLTPSEVEILLEAQENPNVFTEYFFASRDGSDTGWRFDDNFTEDGAWQRIFHEAEQRDITVIGGFGTGKTLGVAMSAVVMCCVTKDFKFLNVAQKQWQAKQMYDLVALQARNTRFEDLIWERPRKPYPKITLRYRIGKAVYESTMEFMSVDKDATGILSWEGDWINIDEAGLLDNLEEVVTNVGSRLRGSVKGRERLGRFSMTSNSWDNFYLWYYFDQADADPTNYLSLVVSSRSNKNVTEQQLARMLQRIPVEERARFIEGSRPEGKGHFFAKENVYACEIAGEGPLVQSRAMEGLAGYQYEKLHGCGVVSFMRPSEYGHFYMLFGDPGIDGAPHRNSPVLMVWDVTNFPKIPARLVCFWWGNGGGKITVFIQKMFDLIETYKPGYSGIDSTSTQKNVNVLINEYLFKERFPGEDGNQGYDSSMGRIAGISGLDFSGSKKIQYLQTLRLFVEGKMMTWPRDIVGMRSQLTNYDYEVDKKIAQDIVATMSMSAHAIRMWFHVSPEELTARNSTAIDKDAATHRRLPSPDRNRRAPRPQPAFGRSQ